ncbi:protein farnesyltransferase subunit beta [Trichomonascus vanleenenianus]|uniref:protein farnesyltransferase n=1 Tax=Trichomonascus vanleenenianus TaxID=2268995 RepID=UPI003EC96909
MPYRRKIMSLEPHGYNIKLFSSGIKSDYITKSLVDQLETEKSITELYEAVESADDILLDREHHISYLRGELGILKHYFKKLDASQSWMVYWTVNALSLLGDDEEVSSYSDRIGDTLLKFQNPTLGAFGGGAGQNPHLATTYAAVHALPYSNEHYWSSIDRPGVYRFLMEMKQPDGSFTVTEAGESDLRGTYCALAAASLLRILTPELVEGCADYIARCQTYEGGFGAAPRVEAHGGYAYCGLAALWLIGGAEMVKSTIDVSMFVKWLSRRQSQPERSFSGRSNKLVDGCYSHWVGGCWAIIENVLPGVSKDHSLWDRQGLYYYTLVAGQDEEGGLRDKPSASPDTYHSNYSLCGLSASEHCYQYNGPNELGEYGFHWSSSKTTEFDVDSRNLIKAINPIHVLPEGYAERFADFCAGN